MMLRVPGCFFTVSSIFNSILSIKSLLMSNSFALSKVLLAFSLLVTVMVSCKNYEKVYLKNFDFPPPDSTKFATLDGNSGKLFDMLTVKSTGIDFQNSMEFRFLEDNNL